MKALMGLTFAAILVADFGVGNAQEDTRIDRSHEVIDELVAHLPKRAITVGKDLPSFIRNAVKELARVSSLRTDVEAVCARLAVIADMDRFLDFKRVTDPKDRDLIKSRRAAFTINEQWPIYINGESDLYSAATEAERRSAENPFVYKLAAIIWHEMVHAGGEADEAIALTEEIKMLEILRAQGLVELEWVNSRKVKLAQIQKRQVNDGPVKVKTSKP
jgi:hypothetical protein